VSGNDSCNWCVVMIACVQLQESKQTIDALEKERDFYFGKLRDIEVLCQEHESDGNPVLQQIMDILYATEVSSTAEMFFICSCD